MRQRGSAFTSDGRAARWPSIPDVAASASRDRWRRWQPWTSMPRPTPSMRLPTRRSSCPGGRCSSSTRSSAQRSTTSCRTAPARARAPGGAGSLFCEDDEDIWSTIWPGSDSDCQGAGSLTGYETLAGTSMASPSAAGVSALLYGKGLTNAQIMECLKRTSSNRGAYDPVYGYGIIDADAATAQCASASTPSYVPTQQPASGGGTGSGGSGSQPSSPAGGALILQATIVRASRASVARRGLFKARVSANRPVSGRLIA